MLGYIHLCYQHSSSLEIRVWTYKCKAGSLVKRGTVQVDWLTCMTCTCSLCQWINWRPWVIRFKGSDPVRKQQVEFLVWKGWYTNLSVLIAAVLNCLLLKSNCTKYYDFLSTLVFELKLMCLMQERESSYTLMQKAESLWLAAETVILP